MKKMLSKALGTVKAGLGVIGRVDKANGGKSIIEIGHGFPDGTWEKITNGGHIALTPDEREELIKVLESHRDVRMYEIGDAVGVGFEVVAVQYLNATADGGRLQGTILAYADHKREWAVLTAFANGAVEYGTYTRDSQRALNAYYARIGEHLFPHFNVKAPSVTYAHVADRDKLSGSNA